jgi:hypothetical protein
VSGDGLNLLPEIAKVFGEQLNLFPEAVNLIAEIA